MGKGGRPGDETDDRDGPPGGSRIWKEIPEFDLDCGLTAAGESSSKPALSNTWQPAAQRHGAFQAAPPRGDQAPRIDTGASEGKKREREEQE